MYQRTVSPAVMRTVRAAPSQGAGGAIPRGISPIQGSSGADYNTADILRILKKFSAVEDPLGNIGEAIPYRAINPLEQQNPGSMFGAQDQLAKINFLDGEDPFSGMGNASSLPPSMFGAMNRLNDTALSFGAESNYWKYLAKLFG